MLRLGLRWKFFLHSNALILVSVSIGTLLAIQYERQNAYDAIQRRGVSITEVLAIPITDALLYQELGLVVEEGLIDNYVNEILERNRDLVRYVIVADGGGRVTHSNRWELLGRRYERALGPDAIGAPTVSDLSMISSGEQFLEVRAPLNVSSRFLGSVAVGFSLTPIQGEIRAITRKAVLIALVLVMMNSLLTAAYVESLIRPILQLNRIMKSASEGDLTVRADAGRGDEVRELGAAFNGMMTELERARTREKAQGAQLARAEKMAAVGTLAAGVAHEVNNPLAGIRACLDMIEGADPDDSARYLALVRDGIKRIERTVLALLDFSRPREVEAKHTSVNEALERVVELVTYQLRANRITPALDLAPDGAFIFADPFQLEQLFLNLVLNAIQAMPSGGTLTLRTSHLDGAVAVEIVDTGVGIPAHLRARVFDPFFTTRALGQGTGLGLSVSYEIVTAHGGSIEVDGEEGRGTTFRVVLPKGAAKADETVREIAS